MQKRISLFVFLVVLCATCFSVPFAQDAPAPEAVPAIAPAPAPAPAATPAPAAAPAPKAAVVNPADTATTREVPVRYFLVGDSVEQEAIFVKIEKDTVYLRAPDDAAQKVLEEIRDEEAVALQESNGQKVEEEEEFEDDDKPEPQKPAEVIMTDAVKDSLAAKTDSAAVADSIAAAEAAKAAEIAADAEDDLEAALEKEEKRLKMEEVAKVEAEIREREIRDSLANVVENPYIKIFRLDLKRLYNLEDKVMIDLSLSNYVVPVVKDEEEEMELYPPGKANLLVTSNPEACSLFVNGIALMQVAPDTIKNIKPGKYTISVMKVLRDVEWWGTATVKINADSLNKVEIPVQRPSTRITLSTNPEAVEVYVGEEPTINRFPDYMTDLIVDDVKPQPQMQLFFRKVGYRDTSITTEIKAFMPNFINVELQPIDDIEYIQGQREFNQKRSDRRVGKVLLWSSIAPILAGGVLWYLAERNWSDAADKKHEYNRSVFDSEKAQRLIKDNHDLNKSGDTKAAVGIGLGVIGAGLLVAGVVFAF